MNDLRTKKKMATYFSSRMLRWAWMVPFYLLIDQVMDTVPFSADDLDSTVGIVFLSAAPLFIWKR